MDHGGAHRSRGLGQQSQADDAMFDTTPEVAHITASTNYFVVVCFHSVAVFIPMFISG